MQSPSADPTAGPPLHLHRAPPRSFFWFQRRLPSSALRAAPPPTRLLPSPRTCSCTTLAPPPNPGPRPERIPPLVGLGASSGLLRPPTGLRRHRNTLRPATASLSPRSTQPSRRTPASLARLAAQAHGPRTLPVTAETALPKDARGPMSACPVLVLRSLGPSVLQLPDTFPWTPPALLTLASSLGFPWPRPLPRVFSRLWGPLLSLGRCFLVWGGCASQLHPAPALAPGQPSPGPQPQHRLSAGSCPSSRECRPRPPGASTAVIRIPKAPPAQHIQSGTCPLTPPHPPLLARPPKFSASQCEAQPACWHGNLRARPLPGLRIPTHLEDDLLPDNWNLSSSMPAAPPRDVRLEARLCSWP